MSAPDVRTARLGEPQPPHELPPEFMAGWTRYAVIRRVGSGGMGEVFKAWDPQLGRHVALKFLYGTDAETLERFAREARAQARVDHPDICKVYEVGSVAGRPYIAMHVYRVRMRLAKHRAIAAVAAIAFFSSPSPPALRCARAGRPIAAPSSRIASGSR